MINELLFTKATQYCRSVAFDDGRQLAVEGDGDEVLITLTDKSGVTVATHLSRAGFSGTQVFTNSVLQRLTVQQIDSFEYLVRNAIVARSKRT